MPHTELLVEIQTAAHHFFKGETNGGHVDMECTDSKIRAERSDCLQETVFIGFVKTFSGLLKNLISVHNNVTKLYHTEHVYTFNLAKPDVEVENKPFS